MQTFKINKDSEIVCRSEGTRYGFRHLASLMVNGHEIEKDKACYYNRTWERFQFETVIRGVLGKTERITKRQKDIFLRRIGSC